MAVLGAPGFDHLNRAVVAYEREADIVDAVARPDLPQQGGVDTGENGGAVEAKVDLYEEIVFVGQRLPREGWEHSILHRKSLTRE